MTASKRFAEILCLIEAIKTEVFFTSIDGYSLKRNIFEMLELALLRTVSFFEVFHLKNWGNEEGSE